MISDGIGGGTETDQMTLVERVCSFLTWSYLWGVLDASGLILVLLLQGSLLNYYLVYYNDGESSWYFWFLSDFVVLIVFMVALTYAKKHYRREARITEQIRSRANNSNATPMNAMNLIDEATSAVRSRSANISLMKARGKKSGRNLFNREFPVAMGLLPLIYLAWLIYSANLIIKIFIIFDMDIHLRLEADSKMGIQILELCLAAAAVVLMLWVEAHRNMEDEVQREITKNCTNDLITHTVFEIFDSVTFLDLLLPNSNLHSQIPAPPVILSLQNVILCLASVNFLLPTLGLLKLSRIHFGSKLHRQAYVGIVAAKVQGESRIHIESATPTSGLGLSILIHIVRMAVINVPYFIIRCHMSTYYDKEFSIFALKNVLGIVVTFRSLLPELRLWLKLRNSTDRQNAGPRIVVDGPDGRRFGFPLPVTFDQHSNQETKTKFEDIKLNNLNNDGTSGHEDMRNGHHRF